MYMKDFGINSILLNKYVSKCMYLYLKTCAVTYFVRPIKDVVVISFKLVNFRCGGGGGAVFLRTFEL